MSLTDRVGEIDAIALVTHIRIAPKEDYRKLRYHLDRIAVATQLVVGGQQYGPLDSSLGEQQTVERIFVDRRQITDRDRMFAGDWQFGIAVVQEASPQQPRIGLEIRTAQASLEGDLPEAGGAEIAWVIGILDQPPGIG